MRKVFVGIFLFLALFAAADFAAVQATNTSFTAASDTSHTVSLPAGIQADDLLLVFFATDGDNTISNWDGFTEILNLSHSGNDVSLSVAWKIAVGSDTLTVTTNENEGSSHASYRITGHNVVQMPEASTGAEGDSVSPDPDSLDPAGPAKDFLWFAAEANDRDQTTAAWPTNFTGDNLEITEGGANGCNIGVGTYSVQTATQDPAVFTIDGQEEWVAATVVVHPAGAIVRYVDPDAGGSGSGLDEANAYTTLQAFDTGENADLTALGNSYIAYCLSSSGTADNSRAWITGWTTSATYYIQIEAASGHEADADGWDADKYRLDVTDTEALLIQEEFVRVVSIQMSTTYSAAANKATLSVSTADTSDIRIDSCRIKGDTADAGNVTTISVGGGADLTIYNSIVYDADSRLITHNHANSVLTVYNSTFYNGDFSGIDNIAGTASVTNTAVFVTGNDFNGTISIDYCASDDNDGTNNVAESGGGADWPDDFTAAGSGNFELVAGSNLIGAGEVNPEGGSLYADDIDGTTRGAAWDVGAHEFVSAQSIVPLVMMQMDQLGGGMMLASLALNMILIITLIMMLRKMVKLRSRIAFFENEELLTAWYEVTKYLEEG